MKGLPAGSPLLYSIVDASFKSFERHNEREGFRRYAPNPIMSES